MLIGYNTNVSYKGKMYHIQTEDAGSPHCFITTLLYHEGAILRSLKTGYAEITALADFKEKLRDMMKRQHREIIKGLLTGKFTNGNPVQSTGDEAAKGRSPEVVTPIPEKQSKSLDDILIDHISKKVIKK